MIDPILREAETKMAKSVDHFAAELTHIRTGRANPALIDKVMVPYYGTPTPLNQLAQINAPEPRLLVVQVYDKSQIGAVEKALRSSDQGLNPANDGQVIRVPIPRGWRSATCAATSCTGSNRCRSRVRSRRMNPSAPPRSCRRSPSRRSNEWTRWRTERNTR